MFRSTGNFDKILGEFNNRRKSVFYLFAFPDKASSNLLMEPDWVSILLLCDLIRQNDVQ